MQLALLYHAVIPIPAHVPTEGRTLLVEPEELAWQLAELERREFRTLSLDEFYEGADDDDPLGVLLTFDDAYAHVIETVTPMLQEHGQTAVLFVPWGHAGGTNDWDEAPLPVSRLAVAGPSELRDAVASGCWELGGHGVRHLDLRTLEPGERLAQLLECRRALSELAGREVLDLAYPFGAHDEAVRGDVRSAGFRTGFAAERNSLGGPYNIPRLPVRGQEGRRAFTIKIDPELRRLFK